jgi:hypothetical protein
MAEQVRDQRSLYFHPGDNERSEMESVVITGAVYTTQAPYRIQATGLYGILVEAGAVEVLVRAYDAADPAAMQDTMRKGTVRTAGYDGWICQRATVLRSGLSLTISQTDALVTVFYRTV